MCEILAISSRHKLSCNPYLREFFQDSPQHPHGWGMAWQLEDGVWFDKEPLPAYCSDYLNYLLEQPIRSEWLIAHIRNATRGVVTYDNCHPFHGNETDGGRLWVFAHNGTILADELIREFSAVQHGSTDSERVLFYLIRQLDDACGRADATLGFEERFALLADALARLAPGNKVNVAFQDGDCLYVHTNTIQPTLYQRQREGVVQFCTVPLPSWEGWEEVPRGQLFAWRDGELVAQSAPHGQLFDNEEYLRRIASEAAIPALGL